MISNQEEDEFVAVRVQDPRMHNEGSWNSYVDYKIFLHTNSKAFTAKTSCVRRRYSEFEWLKKKLQKNAGLVPVPDLPGKSFFSFSNEDFLERRRKGLQAFLDSVVNMTVCLSDSQLHLFLQTQLPVGHIQDCVQGHTPYTVTEAILTYASSNRGLAQALEDDSIKEPSLTVSYESMESPAPHQPTSCMQPKETFCPELLSCGDPDPLDDLLEVCNKDTVEFQHKEKSSVKVLQKNNHLEAVFEDCSPSEVTFFLGDSQDVPESLSLTEQTQQRSCQIQTPVEVHSPMGADFEEKCGVDSLLEEECSVREESTVTLDTEEQSRPHSDTEEKAESSEEAKIEKFDCEPEKCVNSVVILDFKEQGPESEAGSQQELLDVVCSEKQVLEIHAISEVNGHDHVVSSEVHAEDVSCPEEFKSSDGQKEPDDEKSDESESKEETTLESEIHEEDIVEQMDQVEQEVDVVRTKDDSNEDSHSSSNESIVKVSDEESVCDETEDSFQAANGYMKTSPEEVTHWSEVEVSSRNILDLHMNGCPVEKQDISAQEDEDVQYITDISDFSKSLDLNSTVTGGDLTENSDFRILESSCTPGLADSKCTEQETLSLLSLDASEETHEVEVH
ncbi:sorting nexin-11 [Epinephelus moara]|uniref:sorting nexin-11 n=1 Tax=Epinephelus moara TaxID=300413 RepID=UPI00214E6A61|nr:sorting nexin-11 [Epinephelus moara]XP_049915709.1 sorting nexin-11 [Epinephelus moara]